jgi:hypothetical protein
MSRFRFIYETAQQPPVQPAAPAVVLITQWWQADPQPSFTFGRRYQETTVHVGPILPIPFVPSAITVDSWHQPEPKPGYHPSRAYQETAVEVGPVLPIPFVPAVVFVSSFEPPDFIPPRRTFIIPYELAAGPVLVIPFVPAPSPKGRSARFGFAFPRFR